MQETNITFSGLALTPYSDISPDGQLSACIGLESHGGALRPSLLAGKQYTPPADGQTYTLIHQHATSAYSHFIFRNGDSLFWAEVTEEQYSPQALGTYTGLSSVNTVGNTLVVLTSSGLHYLLWKEGSYSYIGQQPPEIGIMFGLYTETYDRLSDAGTVRLPRNELSGPSGQITIPEEDDQRTYITEVVWNALNKVIEGCSADNRFCMPFFVRAAYRRFDGSYTMLTSPVLMIPDSTGPKAFFTLEKESGSGYEGKVSGRAWASQLVMAFIENYYESLQSWSDIITAIDIFVSPQVMRADMSQQIDTLYGDGAVNQELVNPPNAYGIAGFNPGTSVFQKKNFDWERSSTETKYFHLPLKKEDSFLQDINENVNFYRVRSISVSRLYRGVNIFYNVLERKFNLANLVQSESLPDSADYQSHDKLIPAKSHVYNQRLHLFDVERTIFSGYLPQLAWPYTSDGEGGEISVYVQLSAEDGGVRTVKVSSSAYNLSSIGRFLYYPDAQASLMIIKGEGFSYEIPLQPHPLLNGAYFLFIDNHPPETSVSLPETSAYPVKQGNKVYTSEVGNPFYFPLEGIYTVGSGQIFGVSSIATALSQGQFGQFPLMIFCSDGNYAMSVNEEGRYSAIHPVHRDVCANPESITQTDSEVLFVSSRGVMVTSGAAVQNLSERLNGVLDAIPGELPFVNPAESPSEFFRSCLVAYDYTNRRIVFFSPGKDISYIYSIEGQAWTSASLGHIVSVVNRFPYSYVQLNGGTVVELSETYPYTGQPVRGLIYTRPVKMDTFALKKLLRLSVQGIFSRKQNVLIYASNDGTDWFFIGRSGSSRILGLSGRKFRYYRFAVETHLEPSENISTLRVQFEICPERRLR